MSPTRVTVGQGNPMWEYFRERTESVHPPVQFEIVQYEDVYPTVWAHWGPEEFKVIGYMRDGTLITNTRNVNKIKGLGESPGS